jgi:phosphoribosylformimino-5-aminoimidazole carboxamide ribotide isomerase
MSQNFVLMPALDVLKGRCVQLRGGDESAVIVEGGDPEAAVARFVDEGAAWVHVVDLDGAFGGSPSLGLARRTVVAAGSASIQFGGGLRSLKAMQAALDEGAARIILGTSGHGPGLGTAVGRFGDRLMVAIDARDGKVAIEGWRKTLELDPLVLARQCAANGVARLLVTSIRRDGSLAGPDLELLAAVLGASGLPVIASGGIASLDDLRAVRELGCEGAVVGSAIWLGRFSVAEAIAATA